jgi:phosphate-selective porin OprO/OprP
MTVSAQAQVQGQSEPDLEKLDRMQRQMNLLQQQIQSLKGEIAQAKKKPDNAYAASPSAPKAALPPPPAAPTAVAKMTPRYQPSICAIEGIPGMWTKTGTAYVDNLNCIALTSRLHVDVGGYDYPPTPFNPLHPSIPWTVPQNLDDGINARRARIGVIGTFQGDWVYSLIFDLGGSSDGFGNSTTGCFNSVSGASCRIGLLAAASNPHFRPPI